MNIICDITVWNIFGKMRIEITEPRKKGKEKRTKNMIGIYASMEP